VKEPSSTQCNLKDHLSGFSAARTTRHLHALVMKRVKLQTSAASVWLTSPVWSLVPCGFSLTRSLLFLQTLTRRNVSGVHANVTRKSLTIYPPGICERSAHNRIFRPAGLICQNYEGLKQERCACEFIILVQSR
jgi:hypothetical protein